MYKLVILFEPFEDVQAVDEYWPQFLHLVEGMPKLRRETTSHVERFLYGSPQYVQMHELLFDTLADLKDAMNSMNGKKAGVLLQQMTGGRMALFFAEHKEDNLENILKYRQRDSKGDEN